MQRKALAGVVVGLAVVVGAYSVVVAGRTADRNRREAAAMAARDARAAAARPAQVPRERVVWNWIGERGWPAIAGLNEACSAVEHCRDLPGSGRAGCFEAGLATCAPAVEALEAMLAEVPEEASWLWHFRAEMSATAACVYTQALLAHREHARLMDRVEAGTASESFVRDLVEGGRHPELAEIDSAMSNCMAREPSRHPDTDGYLRAHFGCFRLRSGTAVPWCCTAERAAQMFADGLEPTAPDPTCP